MAYEKLSVLADKLANKTIDGSIDWEETADKGVYQAAFATYSVQISTRPGQFTDELDFVIRIFDDDGNEIEMFSDADISVYNPPEQNAYFYKRMKEMYESARRIAMGTEQAINKILEELDDDFMF